MSMEEPVVEDRDAQSLVEATEVDLISNMLQCIVEELKHLGYKETLIRGVLEAMRFGPEYLEEYIERTALSSMQSKPEPDNTDTESGARKCILFSPDEITEVDSRSVDVRELVDSMRCVGIQESLIQLALEDFDRKRRDADNVLEELIELATRPPLTNEDRIEKYKDVPSPTKTARAAGFIEGYIEDRFELLMSCVAMYYGIDTTTCNVYEALKVDGVRTEPAHDDG